MELCVLESGKARLIARVTLRGLDAAPFLVDGKLCIADYLRTLPTAPAPATVALFDTSRTSEWDKFCAYLHSGAAGTSAPRGALLQAPAGASGLRAVLLPPATRDGRALSLSVEGGGSGGGGASSSSSLSAAAPPAAKRPRAADAPPPAADAPPPAALVVAHAYDGIGDAGLAGRKQSPLLHLRNFQNWVKAVLIAAHAPRPAARVLDLCCGKLGDVGKWARAGATQYVGVDISRASLEHGVARLCGARGPRGLSVKLAHADLGAVELSAGGVVPPGAAFDAASVQMAVHYFFDTEARAATFFRNAAGHLAPGGVLVGTTPDADVLVRRLRDAAARGGREFGNRFFRVRFSEAGASAQWRLGAAPFGVQYEFFLEDAVQQQQAGGEGAGGSGGGDGDAGGVPEYLVPWEALQRLAAAAGLVPLASDNFHAFFARHAGAEPFRGMLRSMSVLDCEGALTQEQWDVAGLYRVFAFKKAGGGGAPLPATAPAPPAPAVARAAAQPFVDAQRITAGAIIELLGC
jgi:mRNA (guanine-N7-)-methyltransferase